MVTSLRLVLVSGLLVAASGAWADPQTAGTLPAPTTPQQKSALLQMQDAFTSIAQTVEPTVVNIKSMRLRPGDEDSSSKPGSSSGPRRLEATGSGVIVRADGYILTNDHVVEQASGGTVTVTLADGREFPGQVFPDFASDLAVVKINPGSTPLPVAGFADDALVRPGQWAIAVGSPFDLQNTMTVGVISAIGRHQSIAGDGSAPRYYPDLLQTDAAINPGNSGGPLFDIDGKVVGINVAIESPVEGSAGVGFAIPSHIAQAIMNALITSGKVTRGYLGIAPEDLTPTLAAQYGQKDGALVRDIQVDSPAGRAGVEAGDIITVYDGRPVHGEVSLRELISATPPGRTITLQYVRDSHPGTASVTLGRPQEAAESVPASKRTEAGASAVTLGVSVRTLTASDRVASGFAPTARGVFVLEVAPNSPLEAAGIAAGLESLRGAVIEKIGQRVITTKSDYTAAVLNLPRGSSAPLVLLYTSGAHIHQTVVSVQL